MHRRTAHKLTISSLESLEDRTALSTTPANPLESLVNLRGGGALGTVYTEFVNYHQAGSHGAFNSSLSGVIEEIGPTVGLDIRFNGGNFLAKAAQVEQMGLMVTAAVPSLGIIEGFMPIAGLPSVALDQNVGSLTPVYRPVANDAPTPVQTVAMKGGTALASIYQEYQNYEQAGGQGAFSPVEAGQIVIQGTSVGIDIRTPLANYGAMLGEMQALGMQVTATAGIGQVAIIEGLLPISQLPTVAANADLVGMSPIYRPVANAVG